MATRKRMRLSIVFALLAVLFLQTFVAPAGNIATAQDLPPAVTAYSSVSVRVDNISFIQLFNFTTNLDNDILWFPNVEETQLIHTGPNGQLAGSVYIQRSYFNGIPLDTTVNVKQAQWPFLLYSEGSGPIASYKALYTFTPSLRGGVFTLTTEFVSPGITRDNLSAMLTLAMQNILNYYNTTGKVSINFIYITS